MQKHQLVYDNIVEMNQMILNHLNLNQVLQIILNGIVNVKNSCALNIFK